MELERVKSMHVQTSKLSDEEKLRKLRTWKHHRAAGHEREVMQRRLHTSLETLRKWATALEFDLGKDAGNAVGRKHRRTEGGER